MRIFVVLALATAFVAGCTAATIPLRPLDATHPASPEAREAPVPALHALAVGDDAPAASPRGHRHAH